MRRNEKFPIDIFEENFLRRIFALSDEHSLPEIPPNYPPFFSWDKCEGYHPQKIIKLWKESNFSLRNRERIPTIYVHIPFCQYICRFCGFYRKIPGGSLEMDSYLRSLAKESAYFNGAFKNFPIRNLCFGGGTPTMLSEKQLDFLISTFRKNFTITPNTRIAMEASPHTLTFEKALKLKELGVNYLSIGIQSFDEKLMRSLGRPQTREQAINALKNAQKAGIENVQADLLVGLPGQTEELFMKDIEILSDFELQRVYIFDWQPREFAKYDDFHSASLDRERLNMARMWRRKGIDRLIEKRNYVMRCGHWIFKGKGEEWPYTYDQQEEEGYSILGLGATSITYCADKQRYQNVSDVKSYISMLKKGLLPIEKIAFLSQRDEAVNYAIIKFLHIGQMVRYHFASKYGKDPEKIIGKELERLLKDGKILKSADSYVLKDRASGVFDLKSVFYSEDLIKKMAKYAGQEVIKKSSISEKRLERQKKNSKNLKLCFLRDGISPENPAEEIVGLKERPIDEIFSEISQKISYGLKNIIFCDSEKLEFSKAYLLVSMARKKNCSSSFLCPGFLNIGNREAVKLKKAGLISVYLPLSSLNMKESEIKIFKEAGIKIFSTSVLSEKAFAKIKKDITRSSAFGIDGLVFILPAGYKKYDAYRLYKKLRKNVAIISAYSEKIGHKTVVANATPCLLYPWHEKLYETFTFIPDARENESGIIKLETCLHCKYLLYCPGPHEQYLEKFVDSPIGEEVKYYSTRDGKFYDIKPIKK